MKRRAHFYKAYCRLGIHNLPHGQEEPANGVEKAPDFILTRDFLDKFPGTTVDSFQFQEPIESNTEKTYELILSDTKNFTDFINKHRDNNNTQVVIGGDHCVTFGSTLSDIDNFGTNIGFIHFDSHGDINLYHDSPSKNFHGMYIRVLADKFDLKQFDDLVPVKIPMNNLFFVGDVELDPGEVTLFKEKNLPMLTHMDFDENPAESLQRVRNFVSRFQHIHISFDVDVFNRDLVSATGTPSQDGFQKEPIFKILQVIAQAPSLSLDVAEVNPTKEGAQKTIELAQEVIQAVIA